MLTLTSKMHFGAMRGCQEQTREENLGGSPRMGWVDWEAQSGQYLASEVGCYNSTTNTFNSGVDKYYMKKMYDIHDFDVSKYWG